MTVVTKIGSISIRKVRKKKAACKKGSDSRYTLDYAGQYPVSLLATIRRATC